MEWEYFEVGKKIKIEGFYTAFEHIFETGHVFSGESHDFWEMMYVIDGEVCVSADERVLNLKKNDIIFHKPLELHKFHIEKDAHLFITTFSAVGDAMCDFENRAASLSLAEREYMFNLINFTRENCRESGDHDIFKSPSLIGMYACLTELFFLSIHQSKKPILSTHNSPDAIIFKKAVQVMEKCVGEWMSVPEIAVKCNVSVSYLKKIFDKYSGLGVHKYFLKTKLIAASQMLKDGKNVSETADELGFSSQNYFSMVFKREMGISPLNYRNRYK